MASGSLKRNMRTATGVTASTAPEIGPSPAENQRRTLANTTATVATPISACGTRMLQAFTPNTRAESDMTQSEAGGLSTVIALAASKEPKKNAFQLDEPACTAAE